MKMNELAGSKNDEFYTPKYAITPLIKHLRAKGYTKIWCPFDTPESLYIRVLENAGFKVKASHIDNDGDFFKLIKDKDWLDFADAIVSNPPYSMKTEILTALFESKKPFAMLVGIVGLFESQARFKLFRDHPFEIMYLNLRVSYMLDYADAKPVKRPPFSSVYVTSQLLPKQIVFEMIDTKDLICD